MQQEYEAAMTDLRYLDVNSRAYDRALDELVSWVEEDYGSECAENVRNLAGHGSNAAVQVVEEYIDLCDLNGVPAANEALEGALNMVKAVNR